MGLERFEHLCPLERQRSRSQYVAKVPNLYRTWPESDKPIKAFTSLTSDEQEIPPFWEGSLYFR
jgi:hypothetical protein